MIMIEQVLLTNNTNLATFTKVAHKACTNLDALIIHIYMPFNDLF